MVIKSFSSLDEMFAAVDRAAEEAGGRVRAWQAAIKPGDFFVKLDRVVIYGEVLDPGVRREGSCLTDRQLEEDANMYRQPHMRNYRATKSYSVMCPEGEFGDQHVSTIAAVITKEQFEKFREVGWPGYSEALAILKEPKL